ncbi:Short-chain dehydrogenase/reductase SDR [Cordyceps militaris CM01]|uniref:Short-chain dehydrogenase/reductase SDR n=1 Tax=Cordyceps militaris (strain CM01) TaxID=983644 RepID=G3J4W6_CORMM|nr:Short-chain dehydrogenase/reductase SDR [Cordyceps militaris CM01]EGX95933.1 Short-chain dehydrogenase/reductase SDR [Cordyceps militaris CM01]
MASAAKTIVATGLTSGLGFEALKQLLQAPQPYRIVLGARNVSGMEQSLRDVPSASPNMVEVLPLDLADLQGTKQFAEAALRAVGDAKIDYLFLNAGITDPAAANPRGYRWCEQAVVNHVAQFYLVHLLREKLEASKGRIVFVSSGAATSVSDPSVLEDALKSGAGTADASLYCKTKFVQLLGAHWWRRQLAGVCDVVAVSPGLIPGTGLGRGSDMKLPAGSPDAKTIPQGAQSMLAALTRSDFPEDPDRIFLTSWGEWWDKAIFATSLDKKLQDKWAFSKEDIEKEAGISPLQVKQLADGHAPAREQPLVEQEVGLGERQGLEGRLVAGDGREAVVPEPAERRLGALEADGGGHVVLGERGLGLARQAVVGFGEAGADEEDVAGLERGALGGGDQVQLGGRDAVRAVHVDGDASRRSPGRPVEQHAAADDASRFDPRYCLPPPFFLSHVPALAELTLGADGVRRHHLLARGAVVEQARAAAAVVAEAVPLGARLGVEGDDVVVDVRRLGQDAVLKGLPPKGGRLHAVERPVGGHARAVADLGGGGGGDARGREEMQRAELV